MPSARQQQRDDWARARGFKNYQDYRNSQARAQGYKSYAEQRKARKSGVGLRGDDRERAQGRLPDRTTQVNLPPPPPSTKKFDHAELDDLTANIRRKIATTNGELMNSAYAVGSKSTKVRKDSVQSSLRQNFTEVSDYYNRQFPNIALEGYRAGLGRADAIPNDEVRRRILRLKKSGEDDLKHAVIGAERNSNQLFESQRQADSAAKQDRLAKKQGARAVAYSDGSFHSYREYMQMSVNALARRAYNESFILGAADAGYDLFEIIDGQGCGLRHHDDGTKANGMVVDRDTAMANPLAHPNCVRLFVPTREGKPSPIEEPDKSKIAEIAKLLAMQSVAETAAATARQFAINVEAKQRMIDFADRNIPGAAAMFQRLLGLSRAPVIDIRTGQPVVFSAADLAQDIASYSDDVAHGRLLPAHVRQVLGVGEHYLARVAGDAFDTFTEMYDRRIRPTMSMVGDVIHDPRVVTHFFEEFLDISTRRRYGGKHVGLTTPTLVKRLIGGGRNERLAFNFPGIRFALSRGKNGIISNLRLNPNGFLRVGFTRDNITKSITPQLSLIPKGPLRVITGVNRGRDGKFTSLSVTFRLITPKSIIRTVNDMVGLRPNSYLTDLLGHLGFNFSSVVNINLRGLGLNGWSDIAKLRLSDWRKIRTTLDPHPLTGELVEHPAVKFSGLSTRFTQGGGLLQAHPLVKLVRLATRFRVGGGNLYQFAHTVRIPWEDAAKLWRLSDLELAALDEMGVPLPTPLEITKEHIAAFVESIPTRVAKGVEEAQTQGLGWVKTVLEKRNQDRIYRIDKVVHPFTRAESMARAPIATEGMINEFKRRYGARWREFLDQEIAKRGGLQNIRLFRRDIPPLSDVPADILEKFAEDPDKFGIIISGSNDRTIMRSTGADRTRVQRVREAADSAIRRAQRRLTYRRPKGENLLNQTEPAFANFVWKTNPDRIGQPFRDQAEDTFRRMRTLFPHAPVVNVKGVPMSAMGDELWYGQYNYKDGTMDFPTVFTKDWKRIEREYGQSVKDGFHPPGSEDPRSLFLHEYGHHLDNALRPEERGELLEEIFNLEEDGQPLFPYEPVGIDPAKEPRRYLQEKMAVNFRNVERHVSGYAASENLYEELIAEAFTEYLTSPNPRLVARTVGEYFEQAYATVRSPHPKFPTEMGPITRGTISQRKLWEQLIKTPETLVPEKHNAQADRLWDQAEKYLDTRTLPGTVQTWIQSGHGIFRRTLRNMIDRISHEEIVHDVYSIEFSKEEHKYVKDLLGVMAESDELRYPLYRGIYVIPDDNDPTLFTNRVTNEKEKIRDIYNRFATPGSEFDELLSTWTTKEDLARRFTTGEFLPAYSEEEQAAERAKIALKILFEVKGAKAVPLTPMVQIPVEEGAAEAYRLIMTADEHALAGRFKVLDAVVEDDQTIRVTLEQVGYLLPDTLPESAEGFLLDQITDNEIRHYLDLLDRDDTPDTRIDQIVEIFSQQSSAIEDFYRRYPDERR